MLAVQILHAFYKYRFTEAWNFTEALHLWAKGCISSCEKNSSQWERLVLPWALWSAGEIFDTQCILETMISKLGFSNHDFETVGVLKWEADGLGGHSAIDSQNMNANEWETFVEYNLVNRLLSQSYEHCLGWTSTGTSSPAWWITGCHKTIEDSIYRWYVYIYIIICILYMIEWLYMYMYIFIEYVYKKSYVCIY